MSLRRTYTNPLYISDAPDPFVLKHLDTYWCYCTGYASDARCFPILVSTDLVTWQEHGGAMRPLPEDYSEYWAPEVSYWEGAFYLYYSVGDGSKMHIRVAVADSPSGPFSDKGLRLTTQDFAIDPHVFQDDDGRRWFFYATDFLNHTHVGTGTVRDLMIDAFTLAGYPVPIVRAQYDWQLFDPQRWEKGGARWHTVEGPTVLKHKGKYYEMFSGGNWKTASYGVGYASSRRIDTEEEWSQACDGTRVLPLLRTVPGVIGPGHNSVVRGPDNRQLYCVYHRWDDKLGERLLAIDKLDWIGPRLHVFGPTCTPQPAPNLCRSSTRSDGVLGPMWKVISGDWSGDSACATQNRIEGYSEVQYCELITSGFLIECTARAIRGSSLGTYGVSVSNSSGAKCRLSVSTDGIVQFEPEADHLRRTVEAAEEDLLPTAPRFFRIEASGRTLKISSGAVSSDRVRLAGLPEYFSFFTNGLTAEVMHFSLTRGWHDTFEYADDSLADLAFSAEAGTWKIEHMELRHDESIPGAVFKLAPEGAYEFEINVRLDTGSRGFYGFFPGSPAEERGPLVIVLDQDGQWMLCLDRSGLGETSNATFLAALPPMFDVHEYQQFGFTLEGTQMSIRWRGERLCEMPIQTRRQRVGLFASGPARFEMVRVTELVFG